MKKIILSLVLMLIANYESFAITGAIRVVSKNLNPINTSICTDALNSCYQDGSNVIVANNNGSTFSITLLKGVTLNNTTKLISGSANIYEYELINNLNTNGVGISTINYNFSTNYLPKLTATFDTSLNLAATFNTTILPTFPAGFTKIGDFATLTNELTKPTICVDGSTPDASGLCSTPTNPNNAVYCPDGSYSDVWGLCTDGSDAANCPINKVYYNNANGECTVNMCPTGTVAEQDVDGKYTGACLGTPTNSNGQIYCSDGSLPKVDGTCTAGGGATNCGSGLTWNGASCVAPVVPTPTPTPTPTPSNGGGLLPNKSKATDATTWSGLLNIDQANRFGMKFGSGAGKAYHPGAGISGGGIMFTQNPNSTTSCHNGGVNYSGINMSNVQLNTDNTRSNQDGCNLSVVVRKV